MIVLAIAALAASAAQAQVWEGGANLGVQVKSTKGGAVSGASVEIRYRRPGGNVGPDAKLTDSRGQANFVRLAPGLWSLEIRHPDFLSFVASVEIQSGKKPEIVSQFLEATGSGRGTLKVKFLRSDKPFGQVVAGTGVARRLRPEPAPASQPTPAPPAQEERPVSERQRPVSRPAPQPDQPEAEAAPPSTQGRAVPSIVIEPPPAEPPPGPPKPEPEIRAAETPKPLEAAPPVSEPEPAPVPEPPEPDPETGGAAPPTPQEPEPAPMPEPQETAPEPEAAPEPAPEPPTPEPEPIPEPAPPPPPVTEPTPEPEPRPAMPTPEPEPVPAPPVPEPMDEPVQPEPSPTPEASQTAVPETGVESPAEAAPEPTETMPEEPVAAPVTDPSALRAYGDRTCSDCKPGEWAVAVEMEVAGGEPCRPTAEKAVRRAMRDIAAVASDKLGSYSGAMPLDPEAMPLALTTEAARNTLKPYLEPRSACRLLAAVIPHRARFTGFRFEARDAAGSGECTGSGECEIGSSRFAFSPGHARGLGASIVYTLFENTGSAARTARMSSFFVPSGDWTP